MRGVGVQQRVERAQRKIGRLSGEHTAATAPQTWPELIAVLRQAVGFDRWCVVINDPRSLSLTPAAVTGTPVTAVEQRRFWTLETQVPDLNKASDLVARRHRVALLSAAAGGDLARSPRWEDLLGPAGIGDEMRVAVVDHGCWWGSLGLYRDSSDPPFTAADVAVVERLTYSLSGAIRSAWTRPAQCRPSSEGVGTFVLNAQGWIVGATAAARAWLGRLNPGTQTQGRVSNCLLARLQASEENDDRAVSTVLRDVYGEWVELTAARLRGVCGPGVFTIAVQPALTGTVADVLMHAYALTPRERQIASLALTGATTSEIAKRLSLSCYTIADYLTSVHSRTGVHTRHELAQRLTDHRVQV